MTWLPVWEGLKISIELLHLNLNLNINKRTVFFKYVYFIVDLNEDICQNQTLIVHSVTTLPVKNNTIPYKPIEA